MSTRTSLKAVPTKTRKPRRRRMRGSLAVIGGLLVASAIVRIGGDASQAFAREATPAMVEPETATEATSCKTEADIAPILAALGEREDRIKTREADIRTRMQALSVAETEIDGKMAALVEAEQKLRSTLTVADSAAEDDLTSLTNVYATMKPKQASALFEAMDPKFAAGFLARMRPESAAAIMAGLTPTAAYTISVMLAGRNANVPRE